MPLSERIRKIEAERKWQEEQARSVSDWRYKLQLFRHTKPNAQRAVKSARKGFVWIGSHPNYEARLANRWPIRYFLAYGFRRHIWWPLKRVPRALYELHCPPEDRVVRAFKSTLVTVLGREPNSHRDLEQLLMVKHGATLALHEAVTQAYQSTHYLNELSRRIHLFNRQFVLRPGHPGKAIDQYPEQRWIKQLRDVQDDLREDITKVISRLLHLKDSHATVYPTKGQ